jgi:formylglycine-generating enzyme required for sulfatase activity
MEILQRLTQTKRKLLIVVGVLLGVLVVVIVAIAIAATLLRAWESHKAAQIVRNQVGMEFMPIPAGSFRMGSEDGRDDEKPVHQVTISKGFLMGRYEVTQGQWKAVIGREPSNFKGNDFPVQFVTWNDAQEFIRRLNQTNHGYTYRLPTEAEWEYACRAGTNAEYDAGDIEMMAWYDANSENKIHPIGYKHENAWGLYDILGNVSEWCQDWYGKDYYANSPATDPTGPSSGQERVKRGGSRYDNSSLVRSASRQGDRPDGILDTNGFRVVAQPR